MTDSAISIQAEFQTARLSADGMFRFSLERRWTAPGLMFSVMWIMLNPSTADATQDDPTIRRCMGFTKSWGYPGILVGNLWAYRATDPRRLKKHLQHENARTEENLAALRVMAACSQKIVCAWGNPGPDRLPWRFPDHPQVWCLGRTKTGRPRHPLYLDASTPLEVFPQ